ncbi:MAG: coatomer beta' subunit [Amphiamblys sp. WSBS2006]|nr:MAG: coatomer beta' subunit [Amphiamblys sp. WSBS2006]
MDTEEKVLFQVHTEKIKALDVLPESSWVVTAMYSGACIIWDWARQERVRKLDVANTPVRAVRFVSRKNWILCGSDDFVVRAINYNTGERVGEGIGHTDYIRAVAASATGSHVLSCSDDTTIRLWDWDKDWACVGVFKDHGHYVMDVCFHPANENLFLSCSLDGKVKEWSTTSKKANFTLSGHEDGVNCACYVQSKKQLLIVSGSDDRSVRVWDYQTRACSAVLTGHTKNVSSVSGGNGVLVSVSEDGKAIKWDLGAKTAEKTIERGLGKLWSVSFVGGMFFVGGDHGLSVERVFSSRAVASIDAKGRVVSLRNGEYVQCRVDALGRGEKVLGQAESSVRAIQHSPNGRFVAACGDDEHVIYTAIGWRSKAFGKGAAFAWREDSSDYAVCEGAKTVALMRNFKKGGEIALRAPCRSLFGGPLLGVAVSGGVVFYDWEDGALVRTINVDSSLLSWGGSFVALSTEDGVYVLKFNGHARGEEESEEAFDVLFQLEDSAESLFWLRGVLFATDKKNRLFGILDGEREQLLVWKAPIYIVGGEEESGRLVLSDSRGELFTHDVDFLVLEFKRAVFAENLAAAEELLGEISVEKRDDMAVFLEGVGQERMALGVATGKEHRLRLALGLGDIETAKQAAAEIGGAAWKEVGRKGLQRGEKELAEECLWKAGDLEGLFLLYNGARDMAGLDRVGREGEALGKKNVAFLCAVASGDKEKCFDLLFESSPSHAAVFSASYFPDGIERSVGEWNRRVAGAGYCVGVERKIAEEVSMLSLSDKE